MIQIKLDFGATIIIAVFCAPSQSLQYVFVGTIKLRETNVRVCARKSVIACSNVAIKNNRRIIKQNWQFPFLLTYDTMQH